MWVIFFPEFNSIPKQVWHALVQAADTLAVDGFDEKINLYMPAPPRVCEETDSIPQRNLDDT